MRLRLRGACATSAGLGMDGTVTRLCLLQESSRVAPGREGVEKMSTDTMAGSATDTLSDMSRRSDVRWL
jgi:hypothetical protein